MASLTSDLALAIPLFSLSVLALLPAYAGLTSLPTSCNTDTNCAYDDEEEEDSEWQATRRTTCENFMF